MEFVERMKTAPTLPHDAEYFPKLARDLQEQMQEFVSTTPREKEILPLVIAALNKKDPAAARAICCTHATAVITPMIKRFLEDKLFRGRYESENPWREIV